MKWIVVVKLNYFADVNFIMMIYLKNVNVIFNYDSIIIDNLLDYLNLNYEKKSEINLIINYYSSGIMDGTEFLMDEVLEKLKINEVDLNEYENWLNLFNEHEKIVIKYYKKKYKNIKNIKCIYCVDD